MTYTTFFLIRSYFWWEMRIRFQRWLCCCNQKYSYNYIISISASFFFETWIVGRKNWHDLAVSYFYFTNDEQFWNVRLRRIFFHGCQFLCYSGSGMYNNQPHIVSEVTAVLREWGAIWKRLYIVSWNYWPYIGCIFSPSARMCEFRTPNVLILFVNQLIVCSCSNLKT